MTPEAQRIAIAEACPGVFRVIHGKVYWKNDDGLCDPLTDLNAMHEAENKITDFSHYARWLKWIALGLGQIPPRAKWKVVHCTAAQRAEAFLRTIGKWQDP